MEWLRLSIAILMFLCAAVFVDSEHRIVPLHKLADKAAECEKLEDADEESEDFDRYIECVRYLAVEALWYARYKTWGHGKQSLDWIEENGKYDCEISAFYIEVQSNTDETIHRVYFPLAKQPRDRSQWCKEGEGEEEEEEESERPSEESEKPQEETEKPRKDPPEEYEDQTETTRHVNKLQPGGPQSVTVAQADPSNVVAVHEGGKDVEPAAPKKYTWPDFRVAPEFHTTTDEASLAEKDVECEKKEVIEQFGGVGAQDAQKEAEKEHEKCVDELKRDAESYARSLAKNAGVTLEKWLDENGCYDGRLRIYKIKVRKGRMLRYVNLPSSVRPLDKNANRQQCDSLFFESTKGDLTTWGDQVEAGLAEKDMKCSEMDVHEQYGGTASADQGRDEERYHECVAALSNEAKDFAIYMAKMKKMKLIDWLDENGCFSDGFFKIQVRKGKARRYVYLPSYVQPDDAKKLTGKGCQKLFPMNWKNPKEEKLYDKVEECQKSKVHEQWSGNAQDEQEAMEKRHSECIDELVEQTERYAKELAEQAHVSLEDWLESHATFDGGSYSLPVSKGAGKTFVYMPDKYKPKPLGDVNRKPKDDIDARFMALKRKQSEEQEKYKAGADGDGPQKAQ